MTGPNHYRNRNLGQDEHTHSEDNRKRFRKKIAICLSDVYRNRNVKDSQKRRVKEGYCPRNARECGTVDFDLRIQHPGL